MSGMVSCEIADGVAVVTVDNPPANALGGDILRGLDEAIVRIAHDPEARAVVIAGAGTRFFVGGADITEFETQLVQPGSMEERTTWSREIFDRLEGLRQPVIAAVDGAAVGGGLELALLCDFIIAAEGSRFGATEVKIGLIPGGGGTQRLAQRIGLSKTLEFIMLGELIDAEEALRIGLVSRVVRNAAALEAAMAMATKLAALPAIAVQEGKAAVRGGVRLPLPAALDLEREHFLRTAASKDFKEGFRAFLEKRPAVFTHG